MTTDSELAGLDLAVQVAALTGWKWYWSKHNYWNITRPDGESFCSGIGRWQPYDSETGKKIPLPKAPTQYDLDYYPDSDIAEAMRLAAERGYRIDFLDQPDSIGGGYCLVGGAINKQAEFYKDHSGDKLRAACVAICRAVIASKESEGG